MVRLEIYTNTHYYRRERTLRYPEIIQWTHTHRGFTEMQLPPFNCDDDITHVKMLNILIEYEPNGRMRAERIRVFRPRNNFNLVYRTTLWEYTHLLERGGLMPPPGVRWIVEREQ